MSVLRGLLHARSMKNSIHYRIFLIYFLNFRFPETAIHFSQETLFLVMLHYRQPQYAAAVMAHAAELHLLNVEVNPGAEPLVEPEIGPENNPDDDEVQEVPVALPPGPAQIQDPLLSMYLWNLALIVTI